ncbi:MAG: MarR family transcriptional regulator [Erysipelotrichaceae bacterium]|nr:MarR family transcriptional regulator [Erysipelotrichaceae bacterium]
MAKMEQLRNISNRIDILERCRRRYLNKHLSSTGLKGHQFLMLLMILHEPGISQEELSRRIDIDKTRIARSSIFLEESGYIERRRDTADRRKYHLYLTAKGEELIPVIRSTTADFGRIITAGMSDEQIGVLEEMIAVMLTNARNNDEQERI